MNELPIISTLSVFASTIHTHAPTSAHNIKDFLIACLLFFSNARYDSAIPASARHARGTIRTGKISLLRSRSIAMTITSPAFFAASVPSDEMVAQSLK